VFDRDSVQKIKDLIATCLARRNLDLVDISFRCGKKLRLGILVDRPEGGITLAECADLNNIIGELLEQADILPGPYILEVSSPGIDRPLREEADFRRCLNRTVRLYLNEQINGRAELSGIVKEVKDKVVYLQTKSAVKLCIPLDKVMRANQLI
jgi:ribosome maturation factor RimP